jgi:hypothetical protein
MINQVTLGAVRVLYGAVALTVIGCLALCDGIRQIHTGGTDEVRRGWLRSRLFIILNTIRWFLGMPDKKSITSAEIEWLGWMQVVFGTCCCVLALWAWWDVIRLVLGSGG